MNIMSLLNNTHSKKYHNLFWKVSLPMIIAFYQIVKTQIHFMLYVEF